MYHPGGFGTNDDFFDRPMKKREPVGGSDPLLGRGFVSLGSFVLPRSSHGLRLVRPALGRLFFFLASFFGVICNEAKTGKNNRFP